MNFADSNQVFVESAWEKGKKPTVLHNRFLSTCLDKFYGRAYHPKYEPVFSCRWICDGYGVMNADRIGLESIPRNSIDARKRYLHPHS